jgi:CHAD domain-containing protein
VAGSFLDAAGSLLPHICCLLLILLSVRYTVFTAKMATQAGMKRSGSILEREYREYEDELPPPSNQKHGEAHTKLLAREKAAAEAAEAPT